MSDAGVKRFWETAAVAQAGGGYTVTLDGRPLRTPAKAPLVLPTRGLARAIADEWDAQADKVDPAKMPVTRSANAAIDKVTHQHAEVADMLAAYGDSDLLCYRAETPVELVRRQAAGWDPLLDWAADALGARLVPRAGVIHQPQGSAALSRLSKTVHALSPFQLAAFHDLVSLSGSLVIGFAAIRQHAPAEDLWTLSRLDELWQEEQWGVDPEAAAQSALKKHAFLDAYRFYFLGNQPS